MVSRPVLAALAMAFVACGPLEPPSSTGGVSVTAGARGRGHALVMSDYQSTNVALLGCDGRTLSGSFLSSASVAPGLSAPLSGDVVLPSEAQHGDELAVLDRYPAAVVSLIEFATGRVSAQVDVGTGFRANPQDLARIGGELWVTRYESNPSPGATAFDEGGDVLIVDRATAKAVDRIDLSAAVADAPGFLPRPGRMVSAGGRLYVLLSAYDAAFVDAADSRLVTVDIATRAVVGVRTLAGLAGCSALGIEPPSDGEGKPRAVRRLLVGCSGRFLGSSMPSLDASGLVLLEPEGDSLHEVRRWGAERLSDRPLGFDLAIDEFGHALVTTMGRLAEGTVPARPDALVEVDLDGDSTRVVLETSSRPFELGGVRCNSRIEQGFESEVESACLPDCFIADGEAGRLRRLVRGESGYTPAEALVVEDVIGLPPRWLGRF